MKIGIWKYVNYLLTGYMWGRTISIMHQCVDGTESWGWFALYAFFSVFFTTMDIIEIRATEKKWFDTEEETSILGARVYGTTEESEEN